MCLGCDESSLNLYPKSAPGRGTFGLVGCNSQDMLCVSRSTYANGSLPVRPGQRPELRAGDLPEP